MSQEGAGCWRQLCSSTDGRTNVSSELLKTQLGEKLDLSDPKPTWKRKAFLTRVTFNILIRLLFINC